MAAQSLGVQGGSDTAVLMDFLVTQFESVLRDDPAIDQETRELLQQQFTQALNEAASKPEVVTALPDRAAWNDAVQALQQSGAVGEADANQLIRQFDQALQPLQRRESQLAIEFSRRLQSDGEQEALAWFRQETRKSAGEPDRQASAPQQTTMASPLRSEAVHSRSHRLRGPPGSK